MNAQHWSVLSTFEMDSNYLRSFQMDDSNIILAGSFRDSLKLNNVIAQSNLSGRSGVVVNLSNQGGIIWSKVFPSNDVFHITSVTKDKNNNYFLLGYFKSSVILNTDTLISYGGYDAFCIKLDSVGSILWYKTFGTIHDDIGSQMIWSHSGGINILSDSNSDVFCIFSFGNYQNAFDTLNIDNIKLVSNGYSDIGIIKMNSTGQILMAKNVGGSQADGGGGLMYKNGSIYFCGGIGTNVTYFDNILLNNPNYTTTTFVAKMDTLGNFNWVKGGGFTQTFGTLGISRIAADQNSNIYGVGSFTADQIRFDNFTLNQFINDDIFVIKYDSSGNVKWLRKGGYFGGPNNGNLITVDQQSKVWVFGKASSTCTFGNGGDTIFNNNTSIFVWQCDTLGNEEQFYSVGLSSSSPSGLSQAPNGDILLSGYAQNTTLTFGNLTATVGNQPTLYLARLSPGWPTSLPTTVPPSNDFTVYPNPATSQVSIALPAFKGYTRVFVYDIQGRQVYGVSTQKQQVHIPVIAWPKGMYTVRMTQGSDYVSKMVLIE